MSKPLRDAAPIRMYLMYLRSEGMSIERIAEQSGVPYDTVRRIFTGYWSSKAKAHVQVQKVSDWNAQAILDTRVRVFIGKDKYISTRGARRRIEAMVYNGWSIKKIAKLLKMHRQNVSEILREERTTTMTHQKVVVMYEKMWNVAPTDDYPHDVHRVKSMARNRGYLPAMSWDDIDTDPDIVFEEEDEASDFIDWVVVENAVRGEVTNLSSSERLAVIKVMARRGYSDNQIGEALSITPSAAAKSRRKHNITSTWVAESGRGRPQSTKMVA